MNNERNHKDPWEQGVYETGSTRPPKRRGGLTAILLIAVILLGGIAGLLGLWNIQLFAALQQKNPEISLSLQSGSRNELNGAQVQATEVAVPSDGPTVDLNDAPAEQENVAQPGGLSLQAI